MNNFITILENTVVASTNTGITITNEFENIKGNELLTKLRELKIGNKDGSHFLRSALKTAIDGRCMPRGDLNTHSRAELLIIDCDKRVDDDGCELEGAPSPLAVHQALKEMNIGHIIYGSYSHYTGTKGNRYRIILTTNQPYTKEHLAPTIEACILLINKTINGYTLAYAKENNVFAQGWYYPRRPAESTINHLYFEFLEGEPIHVAVAQILPSIKHLSRPEQLNKNGRVSPIQMFNEQNPLPALLTQYGYKRKLVNNGYEKWLSPESSTGIAGITVKDGKFFSHHNDQFNDGYWHDAFDLMRIRESLTEREAFTIASNLTVSLGVRSVSEDFRDTFNPLLNDAPRPLPESRPPVLPLLPKMLPEAIRDYIFDVANRQQSLPDFAAVAAIVGLSALLGRKAIIYPKQHDDWAVTPNQWGAIIGRPSAMKSPSMKEALKPLKQLDISAAQQFEEEVKNYEEECQLIELEKLEAKNKAKNALKKDNREAAKKALKFLECAPKPVRKRLIVNDATIEKLGELLKENSNGLLLVRDELSGWLGKLNKEEYQTERAFYLECFDGNGNYFYDRIGRGTIVIQNCTLSVIGGIQPSKIAALVRDAIKGTGDDGLIQRFQFAILPDDIGCWEWIDRAPNQQAKEKYDTIFQSLHELSFDTAGGEPRYFRFTNEAQQLFINWMKEIQDAARCADIHPVLESHMLKMPQTIAGLALLFEIIDGGRDAVGIEATSKSLDWASYLLSHAKRLYSIALNDSLDGAKLILKRKSNLDDPLTARTIQRKGWSGLNSIKEVNDALTWLVDYGYIVPKILSSADTNGRPKVVYYWIPSTKSKINSSNALAEKIR
ncbi:YfjI family protein [Legionella sp. CNM-1927-20]|uniref:YfjI family protein n=1 Tax=Legionella sp. CNM-1927-20 TaxID=3422221 RepID=UPI00403B367F